VQVLDAPAPPETQLPDLPQSRCARGDGRRGASDVCEQCNGTLLRGACLPRR
jgi:hypothetical protein